MPAKPIFILETTGASIEPSTFAVGLHHRSGVRLPKTKEELKAIEEKEKTLIKQYGRIGLQFQLFAEYSLSSKKRKEYKEAVKKLNEKRVKEGKPPK